MIPFLLAAIAAALSILPGASPDGCQAISGVDVDGVHVGVVVIGCAPDGVEASAATQLVVTS